MKQHVTNPIGDLPVNRVNDWKIPRGNTQKDVNRDVLRYLAALYPSYTPLRILDMPCGEFELLTLFRNLFPQAQLVGSDIAHSSPPSPIQYERADATQP